MFVHSFLAAKQGEPCPFLANLPQLVLVGIANLLEDGSGGLCRRGLSVAHVEEAELVLHNVGDGLCVCG